ncbi:hypothetical protein [Paenibacillus selenitireducens]|uniref:hypothetical protein n=1 Tax=Paenibacillus selenitireducens TaxID=1324314 RepID=UPI001301AF56|nr:hypothetical protein [Paenibacillus selenitireducens]
MFNRSKMEYMNTAAAAFPSIGESAAVVFSEAICRGTVRVFGVFVKKYLGL